MKTIHIVKQPERSFAPGTARFRAWQLLQAFDGLSVVSFVKACQLMENASGGGGYRGRWVKFFTATGEYANRASNANASEKLAVVRTQTKRKKSAARKPQKPSAKKKPPQSNAKKKPPKSSRKAAIKLREENIRRTAILAGEDPETAIDRARGLGVSKVKLLKKKRKKRGGKKGGYKKVDAMSRRVSGSFESGRR